MKLMIAVPVYNRAEYVDIVAKSLSECKLIEQADVRVYDDCSCDFDINYLEEKFKPVNAKIKRRSKRSPCTENNAFEMMTDFKTSNNDVLLICDSDLLLRPDSLEFLHNNFKLTDGFMSLYNSDLHLTLKKGTIFDLKLDVGFAAMCLSKELVSLILEYKNPLFGDLKISKIISKNNIRVLVPANSMVQHIGISGKHGSLSRGMDYSSSFEPVSEHNKKVISEFAPVIAKAQTTFINKLLFKDKYRKHGFLLHQPLRYLFIRRMVKKANNIEVK